MTDQPSKPVCQWCGLPALGTPTWWNDKPQCEDPHRCDQRMKRQEQP
ncbi:hypothetical protein ACWEG1_05860 [Streptomyces bauhiniae]